MFIAIPTTVWSALKVIVKKAKINETSIVETNARITPTNTLPVRYDPIAAVTAPINIMPSALMFTMPAFALKTRPVAQIIIGAAARMFAARKLVISSKNVT